MAEGCDFGYDDERLDYNIDHGDDDKQVVDTTCPFEPGAASTPITVESNMKCERYSTSRAVCQIARMKKLLC